MGEFPWAYLPSCPKHSSDCKIYYNFMIRALWLKRIKNLKINNKTKPINQTNKKPPVP